MATTVPGSIDNTTNVRGIPKPIDGYPEKTWSIIMTEFRNRANEILENGIVQIGHEAVIIFENQPYICVKRFGDKIIAVNQENKSIIFDETKKAVLYQVENMSTVEGFPNYYYGQIVDNDNKSVFFYFKIDEKNQGEIVILDAGESNIIPQLKQHGSLVFYEAVKNSNVLLVIHTGMQTRLELNIDNNGNPGYSTITIPHPKNQAILVEQPEGFVLVKSFLVNNQNSDFLKITILNSTKVKEIISTRGKTYLLFTIVENGEIRYSLLDPVSEQFAFEKATLYSEIKNGDNTSEILYGEDLLNKFVLN